MKTTVYKNAKLNIYEKAAAGIITESQRDELLVMLEEKKAATELTEEAIKDFFDELVDKYPDIKDDVEKLAKKIEKASDDEGDEGESKEDDENSEEGEESEEKEVSESCLELMELIKSL